MKRFRTFLLPAATFALAWFIARSVSNSGGDSNARQGRIGKVPEPAASQTNNAPHDIDAAFSASPVRQWAALWETFATNASAADLEALPRKASTDRQNVFPPYTSSVLHFLSVEDLAVRTRVAKTFPQAFAALAEAAPEAAWEQLRKNNREALSCAVLRTLAWSNPEQTLERFRTLPAGVRRVSDTGTRSVFVTSPAGSVFGAWARRDPQGALAALKSSGVNGGAELLRSWSFRDGPAALRYIAETSGDESPERSWPMDVILRASFRTSPQETAKLVRAHASLRSLMQTESCRLRALKPWFDADSDGVIAWLHAERPSGEMWLTGRVVRSDPAAAAALIRAFPKAAFPDQTTNITRIALSDPSLGEALADELGLRDKVDAALKAVKIKENPSAACDQWLDAIRRHGPDKALTELGWSIKAAQELAGFAVTVFPDKAKELAALLPASTLAAADERYRSKKLAEFWPELAPLPPGPSRIPAPTFPEYQFSLDPARVAEAILKDSPSAPDVSRVVSSWAPHDFNAARAWLDQVPEGEARTAGELALAAEKAPRDPQATLGFVAGLPRDVLQKHASSAGSLWITCLRRLIATGGDWRPWLDRMPPEIADQAKRAFLTSGDPAVSLQAEASLLAYVRNHPK